MDNRKKKKNSNNVKHYKRNQAELVKVVKLHIPLPQTAPDVLSFSTSACFKTTSPLRTRLLSRWERGLYLLLHAALQQHGDTGLNGEGDLPPAEVQVLLQGLAERGLLHPRLCNTKTSVAGIRHRDGKRTGEKKCTLCATSGRS